MNIIKIAPVPALVLVGILALTFRSPGGEPARLQDTDLIQVVLTVKTAKSLLASLSDKRLPDPKTLRTVSAALLYSLEHEVVDPPVLPATEDQ